jgi:hypothetical protein
MANRTLNKGFDWVHCILGEGSWFNEFMMETMEVFPEKWVME